MDPIVSKKLNGSITTMLILKPNKARNYVDIMAKLSPNLSEANKNLEIMAVFENTFGELESIKKSLNPQMPPTLESRGRLNIHLSHNVIFGGAPKQKNTKQCSICKQIGHNKRSCPLNKH